MVKGSRGPNIQATNVNRTKIIMLLTQHASINITNMQLRKLLDKIHNFVVGFFIQGQFAVAVNFIFFGMHS